VSDPTTERRLAFALCVLAALRVFVYGAAFPFFSNVDEQSHFDLVCKYARGHVPAGLEPWDADAARMILMYGSPEYFVPRGDAAASASPSPRPLRSAEDRAAFERAVAGLVASVNHECTQPPVYYAVAGAWYRVGGWLGFQELPLLYWTRFLNVFIYGALAWLAYRFAAAAFPESGFLRLGVPLFLACFPQSVFYSINNDVLLPLLGGAAFYGLHLISRGAPRGPAFHAGTGLLVAATFLVKFSSVALLPVAAGWVTVGALRRPRAQRRAALANGAVLLAAAAVPVGAWLLRNELVVGDVTASAAKVQILGWTLEPWRAMFDHPLFSLSGAMTFWRLTLATFFRGELVWGLKPLAVPAWDAFYAASSFVFVAAAVALPRTRGTPRGFERSSLGPALALFLLSLAFLASVSVAYDFGDCFYPSRALPYLSSGRLALAALVPFAALYVSGLDALLPSRLPPVIRWTVLIGGVASMTISEWLMSRVAFQSGFNWFHLK